MKPDFLEFTPLFMKWCFAILSLGLNEALKVNSGHRMNSNLLLSPHFSPEPAKLLPIPDSTDIFARYCHADPPITPRLRSSMLEYGGPENEEFVSGDTCDEDSECQSRDQHRPFCIESVCRQCREGNEFSDCGSSAAKCTEDTLYKCSECVDDDDCRNGLVCRFTVHAGKKCLPCDFVPNFGQVVEACAWQCPQEQFYLTESSFCENCPTCAQSQFYASPSVPSSFYTTCTNATDVVCNDCASLLANVDSSFCAQILSPNENQAGDYSIGDLGQNFPCRFFSCVDSWFLDLAIGKCQQCHFAMCAPGSTLVGCGGLNPGQCTACPGVLPAGAAWQGNNCMFTCPPSKVYIDGACSRCDPGADNTSPLFCQDGAQYA